MRNAVVVYCSDGVLSSQAADILSKMGYRVYLMGARFLSECAGDESLLLDSPKKGIDFVEF